MLVFPIQDYTLFAPGRYIPGDPLILSPGEAEVLNSALEEKVLRALRRVWPGRPGAGGLPPAILAGMQSEAERLAQELALGGPKQLWRAERIKEFGTLCAHESERLGRPIESREIIGAALALMGERSRRAAAVIRGAA